MRTTCTCPATAHSDDCTLGAPTVGDRVVLPDGCTGVLADASGRERGFSTYTAAALVRQDAGVGVTRDEAEREADRLWTDGPAIGQVRWRRHRTPRFWVGVCFTDGRPPETRGASNVDWESAFAVAGVAYE